jgi:hypothetical protein
MRAIIEVSTERLMLKVTVVNKATPSVAVSPGKAPKTIPSKIAPNMTNKFIGDARETNCCPN